MTSGFNEDVDTAGKAVPPYEGRREAADLDPQEKSTKDGVKVGGATGPVEDDEGKAPDPERTERGSVASPADEQPASEPSSTGQDLGDSRPSHTTGVIRGEDQS